MPPKKRDAGAAIGNDEAKRARHKLTTLGRTSHVTQRGLQELVGELRRDPEGAPHSVGRYVQYKARKERAATKTPYGNVVEEYQLPCTQGRQRVGIINPCALLFACCAASAALSGLMLDKMQDHPMPWNVLIYADGISPSDTRVLHDRRHLQALYWSFAEFGPESLCREDCWFTLACLRDTLVRDVEAGLSHVTKLLLTQFFFNHEQGFATGIELQLHGAGGGLSWFAAQLGGIVSDEVALAEMLLCKGHGGYKPCILCSNVILHRYFGSFAASDWAVSSTCTDPSKLKLHTDASARETLDRLAELKDALPVGEFKLREKLFGFNYQRHGLLWDGWLAVRVASSVIYDWMHIYLASGMYVLIHT